MIKWKFVDMSQCSFQKDWINPEKVRQILIVHYRETEQWVRIVYA